MFADATYYATQWGEFESAQIFFGHLKEPAQRLSTEIAFAGKVGLLLEHQSLDEIYETVVEDGDLITDESRVTLLLQLQRIGYAVDEKVLWESIHNLGESSEKVRFLSEFATIYNHAGARQLLAESITEKYVADEPYGLLHIADQHPGLLVECEATILSRLLKGTEDDESELGLEMLALALLGDYLAIDQVDEAIELAKSFDGRPFFDNCQELDFQEKVIEHVARKDREHFEEAFSLLATFSKDADSFNTGVLLSKLVESAHEYLSQGERETYLQACDGDYSTFNGWLNLAKSTKKIEYLMRAQQYIKPPEDDRFGSRRQHLISILGAYQNITVETEKE